MQIDWGTRTIFVYKADAFMTNLGGGVYEMDTNAFRLALKDAEDSEAGMPHPDTHSHNTAVSMSGITLAHVVTITNGYEVEFEDGQYAVNLVGTNNNISDVAVVNQVSIRSFNSAGLQLVETGVSGLTTEESNQLSLAAASAVDSEITRKMSTNRAVITENPDGTQTIVVYDDDTETPYITWTVDVDRLIRTPVP